LDELTGYWPSDRSALRKWFFGALWYEVYDFVEFVAENLDHEDFSKYANTFLARELSAVRLVGLQLTRITSETESIAVENALKHTSLLEGVNAHMRSALAMLGDRKSPDYRNSIKESISAVEGICQLLAGEPGATLGAALKRLKAGGVEVHPALEKAWLALYGYTNDKGGIRHAMLDEAKISPAAARYMLVSCSAFVSYLADIAVQAGILIN